MEKNDIGIIHGTEYRAMTKKLLEWADLAGMIGSMDKKIGLKPNLAVAKAPESGATTHRELLEGTIEYLQEHGFGRISILEGSWVGTARRRHSGRQDMTGYLKGMVCLWLIYSGILLRSMTRRE